MTGLVVPSGLATSVATALAMEGTLDLTPFLVAAAAGGFAGDVSGFFIGRAAGERLASGTGRTARFFQKRYRPAAGMLSRHPALSVTAARLVSFVRTLMPMAAGMGGMSLRRFLVYEMPGLVGWVALYVGIGVFAGESWQLAARTLGAGGAAVFLAVAGLLWRTLAGRRRAST